MGKLSNNIVLASFFSSALLFIGTVIINPSNQNTQIKNIPILLYNHIDNSPTNDFATLYYWVSPASFEKQLAYLQNQGYQGLTLSEFKQIQNHLLPFPSKAVVLVFNHPYQDFKTRALPILQKYQFPATVLTNQNNTLYKYLSQEEIVDLTTKNIEVSNQNNEVKSKEVSGVIHFAQFLDLLPSPQLDNLANFSILALIILFFTLLFYTNLNFTPALIIFLIPTFLLRFNFFGFPTNLLEVLIVLAFIAALFQKKISFVLLIKNPILLPLVLFLIAALISTLFSAQRTASLGYFRAFFIIPALFFILNSLFPRKKQNIFACLAAFTGSAVLVGVFSLLQYFNGEGYVDFNLNLLPTFFGNPNYLASYLAPAFIFNLGLFFIKPGKNLISPVYPIILTATAIILGLTLFLVRSEGAYLGILAGVIWIIARRIKKERLFFLGAGFAVILLVFFIIFAPRTQILTGKNSINSRIGMYQTSFEILKEKPLFGTGLANFQNTYEKLVKPENPEQHPLTSHNTYLDFWLQTGALGFFIFIFIIYRFFKISLKIGGKKIEVTNLILEAAMISFLTHSFFDTQYLKNDYAMIFWLLISLQNKNNMNLKFKI